MFTFLFGADFIKKKKKESVPHSIPTLMWSACVIKNQLYFFFSLFPFIMMPDAWSCGRSFSSRFSRLVLLESLGSSKVINFICFSIKRRYDDRNSPASPSIQECWMHNEFNQQKNEIKNNKNLKRRFSTVRILNAIPVHQPVNFFIFFFCSIIYSMYHTIRFNGFGYFIFFIIDRTQKLFPFVFK